MPEDGAAMLSPPSTRFDAVRWERRRADREGRVEVDGTLYCAGPYWHGRWMLRLRDARSRSGRARPPRRDSAEVGGARETVPGPGDAHTGGHGEAAPWEQSELRACVASRRRGAGTGAAPTSAGWRCARSARHPGATGSRPRPTPPSEVPSSAGRLLDEAAPRPRPQVDARAGTHGGSVDLGVYDALAEGGGRLGQRR